MLRARRSEKFFRRSIGATPAFAFASSPSRTRSGSTFASSSTRNRRGICLLRFGRTMRSTSSARSAADKRLNCSLERKVRDESDPLEAGSHDNSCGRGADAGHDGAGVGESPHPPHHSDSRVRAEPEAYQRLDLVGAAPSHHAAARVADDRRVLLLYAAARAGLPLAYTIVAREALGRQGIQPGARDLGLPVRLLRVLYSVQSIPGTAPPDRLRAAAPGDYGRGGRPGYRQALWPAGTGSRAVNEGFFQCDISLLRPISAFALLGVLLSLEWRIPFRLPIQAKFRHAATNLVIGGTNAVVVNLVMGGILLLLTSQVETQGWGLLHRVGLGPLLNLAASVILLDLIFYGVH